MFTRNFFCVPWELLPGAMVEGLFLSPMRLAYHLR